MKKWGVLLFIMLTSAVGLLAFGEDEFTLSARLRGLNETPPINTTGKGSFQATVESNGTISFTETYENLSVNPTVSHIHFGTSFATGGVMIFLCGGGGQPACPTSTSGTISGTISSANVVALGAQGVTVGDLATALRLVRRGYGYVNLHSANFPAGEIRGQVVVHRGDDDRDDH